MSMLRKTFATFIVSFILFSPTVIFAASGFAPFGENGLIPCGNKVNPPGTPRTVVSEDGRVITVDIGGTVIPCTFDDLIRGINGLIQFLFFVSVPLATIGFGYAGWLYMTAAGDTGKISTAHKIFKTIGIGFFFVLAAWLIINLIVTTLVKDPTEYGKFLGK